MLRIAEAAMTERFFGILDHLDYPEIRFLCQLVREARGGRRGINFSSIYVTNDAVRGDEDSTHRERLQSLGLLGDAGHTGHWRFAWLGVKLVEFLERGGYNERDTRSEPQQDDRPSSSGL